MFKRLIVVGFLTGLGHLINILVLKYLSNNISMNDISFIGEVDSLVVLLVTIIAFGLQLSTTRRLAILDDWKPEYYESQSARITLSLFLLVLGLTGYWVTQNTLFLFAPVFALNADFALYGRGMPKLGALFALVRILIPAFCLIFFSIYFIDYLLVAYLVSVVVSYLFVGLLVSNALKVDYFVKPQIKHLKKYIDHLDIGVSTILWSFIGLGLVYVVSYFYNNETIAVIYLILKLYMIFKGVRQIIVQSFLKELIDGNVALKVDYISIIAGFVFLISLGFYPELIVPLFFNEDFVAYHTTFLILAIAAWVSSFTTSSGALLLLLDRDRVYSKISVIAGLATIISSIVLYYIFGDYPFLIALSVLSGEIILSGMYLYQLKEKTLISDIVKLTYPLLVGAAVLVTVKHFIEVNLLLYIGLIALFGIFALMRGRKKISLF